MSDALSVRPVSVAAAQEIVHRWHYCKYLSSQTRLALGLFCGNEAVGVITWGWGVRPLHTIKKLFPSLSSADYWECGRLCVSDAMPRNTESRFLSLAVAHVKTNHPKIRLLFTWADGLLGKPGYVYQAAGWLYGGFIWTDSYFTAEGEKVHPRQYQTKFGEGRNEGLKYGRRPPPQRCVELGLTQYFGKQFRYVKFLCGHAERKRLLGESTVTWSQKYPKHADLEWKQWAGKGSRVSCERPMFTGSVRFRSPAPLFEGVA